MMNSTDFSTLSMQRLVDRIQAGEDEAQDELCRRVGHRLECFARKMLNSFPGVRRWEQTDDVLQSAMMRLLKALKTVRPDNTRAFFGLATEQLRRQLLDLNRHYQGAFGHGRHLVDVQPSGDDQTFLAQREPADQAASPGQLAELERWESLHLAVEKLPAEEREVFGLVFYHGWSQPQVADLMNVSERTVRRCWHSVCLQLSELVKEDLPE